MSSVVIQVDDLGKQYRLGQVGYQTLSSDFTRWWHTIRGKEDPFLKIGETNDRAVKGNSNLVWVLKDINFKVNQGEVLGIIGKNGAGKSTLLKILSKVTSPTIGSVKIKGKIASLLEVGTGFHPELSGRENVFLNGAILGMTRNEIKSKFDAIVDFSGVERYIDTPVKRYSSGMYVRLAFAVAAFLDPEILIVDEVLAVGDAEFQKKCLGKMQDVAGQGRTVLFVSHNLASMSSLCTKGILLKQGLKEMEGEIGNVVMHYLSNNKELNITRVDVPLIDDVDGQITGVQIMNENNEHCLVFDVFDKIKLEITYRINRDLEGVGIVFSIERNGELYFIAADTDKGPEMLQTRKAGVYKKVVTLPNPLKGGYYKLNHVSFSRIGVAPIHEIRDVLYFNIEDLSFNPLFKSYRATTPAKMIAILDWEETAVK